MYGYFFIHICLSFTDTNKNMDMLEILNLISILARKRIRIRFDIFRTIDKRYGCNLDSY